MVGEILIKMVGMEKSLMRCAVVGEVATKEERRNKEGAAI
jgi:hypothetical protein